MIALRRLTALALLGLLLVLPTVSGAATHETHGWWWRAQTGLLGTELPPPPDVPEDGLLVERTPDGATAVSAVRFQLAEGESDPVLVLTVASGSSNGAAIAACQTGRTGWQGEQAGRFDSAPSWDCSAGRVDGVASDDGATWSWELAPLVREDGTISVMLVDGAATPFHVAFEAPTDASLQTTTAPPPPPDAPDPVAPPPGQQEQQPPPSQPPPSNSGGAPVFVPPATPSGSQNGPSGPPAPEVAEPGTSAPTQPDPSSQPVANAAPAATQQGDLPPLAWVLVGALGALVLSDLFGAGRSPVAGRPWRTPDEGDGGIGRFRRTRTERPAALW